MPTCMSCSSTLLHQSAREQSRARIQEEPLFSGSSWACTTFPWTGHPSPSHNTLVVLQIPSVPPGCRFCCPVGVPQASFAFYSCLILLPARVLIGNNEVGENETRSKCTSCWESVSVAGLFLYELFCTGLWPLCPAHPGAAGSGHSSNQHVRETYNESWKQFPFLAPTSAARNCC